MLSIHFFQHTKPHAYGRIVKLSYDQIHTMNTVHVLNRHIVIDIQLTFRLSINHSLVKYPPQCQRYIHCVTQSQTGKLGSLSTGGDKYRL